MLGARDVAPSGSLGVPGDCPRRPAGGSLGPRWAAAGGPRAPGRAGARRRVICTGRALPSPPLPGVTGLHGSVLRGRAGGRDTALALPLCAFCRLLCWGLSACTSATAKQAEVYFPLDICMAAF